MKILLSLSLLFSFSVFADDHESDKPMYAPNVAEYYVNSLGSKKNEKAFAEIFKIISDEYYLSKEYLESNV